MAETPPIVEEATKEFEAAYKTWLIGHGAQEVHASWRDGMLGQGREVSEQRMAWATLSRQDQELDVLIATRLANSFIEHVMPLVIQQAKNVIIDGYNSALNKALDEQVGVPRG